MSKIYFYADDYFFLQGMCAHFTEEGNEFGFINTQEKLHEVAEKIKSEPADSAFVLSFECAGLLSELLRLDEGRCLNFIIVIDTPMSSRWLRINNWIVTSKCYHLSEIGQAINACGGLRAHKRPLRFSRREEGVLSLYREGEKIDDIAKTLNLSPKTVYAFKASAIKKINFERKNNLVYIRYSDVFRNPVEHA